MTRVLMVGSGNAAGTVVPVRAAQALVANTSDVL